MNTTADIPLDISALRRTQLEIADEIFRICENHGLRCMLFGGSLLGAVRHRGFIPWDDDFDVIMPREDYNKFLSIAERELPDGFYLQREFGEHWHMTYTKLRRDGTVFIESLASSDPLTHRGIFADIFPLDSLGRSKITQIMQYLCAKVATAAALSKRGYSPRSRAKVAAMLISRALPTGITAKFARREHLGTSEFSHSFFAAKSRFKTSRYPTEWFDGGRFMCFEDRSYPVPRESEMILTRLYGDYMTPPPEDKRETHAVYFNAESSSFPPKYR